MIFSQLKSKQTEVWGMHQQGGPRHKKSAFSLLELLVVVAVIGLMMALLVPAVAGFSSTSGRKGAVTIVMNTLEQARVSAIETGRETVVVFWKKNGTQGTQPDEPDAMLVLRKNDAGTVWEPITRWIKLPKGILFYGQDKDSAILHESVALNALDTAAMDSLPEQPAKSELGAVQFSASGAVQSPNDSNGLRIALTEGQRDTNGSLVVNRQKAGGHEIISLARYTGRATLDVSELQ